MPSRVGFICALENKSWDTYDFLADTITGITATSWNVNRLVTTVSSCGTVEPTQEATRWVCSEKKKVAITQARVIFQYNKCLGGVDRINENTDR